MKKRTLCVRIGVAAAACAVAAQSAAMADIGTPAAPTKPVHATKADLAPGRMYSSPTFAVDPEDPLRVVAGFADLGTRRCGLLRSTDGAATWALTEASPGTASYPFCSQSQGSVMQAPVAFGRNGTLYMALGGWDDADGARTGGAILLARSRNLGTSWETTVAYTARGKVNEAAENVRPIHSVAVDTKTGNDDVVYVTFNVSRPGLTAPNQAPNTPMVAVSRDGGRTFAAPTNLADKVLDAPAIRDQALTARTTTTLAAGATTTSTTTPAAGSRAAEPNQAANFGGSTGRFGIVAGVDNNGKAYVTWQSGTANVTPAPPAAQFVSTSTDAGRTWTPAMAIPFSYDNATPRVAVAPNGTIHLVTQRNPQREVNSHGEIYHRASSDGGKTWTEPKVLTDDDPNALLGQYFPNISIAPNGRVDAVWWDTRDDTGIRSNDVYYSYSADDGKTWSKNVRITDQSVNRNYGVWGFNYDIASPPGVGSTNEFAIFGWDDTRNTDTSNLGAVSGFGAGTQDVFTSAVQFEAIGGGSSETAKVILAGAVGLLSIGLILLVAALVSRRGSPAPPKKAAAKKDAPAKVG
ncbi:MAG: sialidase family protein [Acidimicrobiales bacterium]